MMTIKEAILKALEDLKTPLTGVEIYQHINSKNYCKFSGKTPQATVQAQAGDFIRKNDHRISRTKNDKNNYLYYLTKYSDDIDTDIEIKTPVKKQKYADKYKERDLHKLLASYLKDTKNIDSKTIYHESSKNNKDRTQKWVHPDMVGVSFNPLKTSVAKEMTHFTTQNNFDLYSYELKREINNDYELKEAYFQALSNSSWANYGYLVVFEMSDNLSLELKRLNDTFGIGIIVLNAYPYYSKVLHTARYKELDIATIDKIANINKDYFQFIEKIQKVNKDSSIKELLHNFCDDIFTGDEEIEKYCQDKHIPQENFEDE